MGFHQCTKLFKTMKGGAYSVWSFIHFWHLDDAVCVALTTPDCSGKIPVPR